MQEYVWSQAGLDPVGHLVDPGQKEHLVGRQVGTADETHLWRIAEGRRTDRQARLLRLGVEHRRIVRTATEQRPRIQADALHATLAQVAVEQALVLAFVEERRVAYFHGNPSRTQLIEEIQQFAQALRGERRRQLQPQRADPFAKRRQQFEEVAGGLEPFAQVAFVTDIAGKLGTEAEPAGIVSAQRRTVSAEGRA